TVCAVPDPVTGLATISYHGYVTNCGDIQLTNVTIVDSRPGPLIVLTNGFPAVPPFSLDVGGVLTFSGSYTSTLAEVCAGTATNTATASGTDIVGGPNATVTSSDTTNCPICFTPSFILTK